MKRKQLSILYLASLASVFCMACSDDKKTENIENSQELKCDNGKLYELKGEDWSLKEDCKYGCEQNACLPDTSTPNEGDLKCEEGNLYQFSDGEWKLKEQCTNGCEQNACMANTDTPNDGDLKCDGGNLYRFSDGEWKLKEQCKNGCEQKACLPESSTPNDGDLKCEEGNLYKFSDDEWKLEEQCANGCDQNACLPEPSTPNDGDLKCEEGNLYKFSDDEWKLEEQCANGCDQNACLPEPSTPNDGDLKCEEGNLYKFSDGEWKLEEQCANGCDQNACLPGCEPTGIYECFDNNKKSHLCENDGSWGSPEECLYGCDDMTGMCKPKCVENDKKCDGTDGLTGDKVLVCKDGDWHTEESCSAGCVSGACKTTCTPDGSFSCLNGNLMKCNQNWELDSACPNGCDEERKRCKPDCSIQGETNCEADGTLLTCKDDFTWQKNNCDHGCFKKGGISQCKPDCEVINESICADDSYLNTCSDDYTWIPSLCPNGCKGKSCKQCQKPGAFCQDTSLAKCSNDFVQTVTPCPDGCYDNASASYCKECKKPGASCDGNDLVTCSSEFKKKTETCPNGCYSGAKVHYCKACSTVGSKCLDSKILQTCNPDYTLTETKCDNGCVTNGTNSSCQGQGILSFVGLFSMVEGTTITNAESTIFNVVYKDSTGTVDLSKINAESADTACIKLKSSSNHGSDYKAFTFIPATPNKECSTKVTFTAEGADSISEKVNVTCLIEKNDSDECIGRVTVNPLGLSLTNAHDDSATFTASFVNNVGTAVSTTFKSSTDTPECVTVSPSTATGSTYTFTITSQAKKSCFGSVKATANNPEGKYGHLTATVNCVLGNMGSSGEYACKGALTMFRDSELLHKLYTLSLERSQTSNVYIDLRNIYNAPDSSVVKATSSDTTCFTVSSGASIGAKSFTVHANSSKTCSAKLSMESPSIPGATAEIPVNVN